MTRFNQIIPTGLFLSLLISCSNAPQSNSNHTNQNKSTVNISADKNTTKKIVCWTQVSRFHIHRDKFEDSGLELSSVLPEMFNLLDPTCLYFTIEDIDKLSQHEFSSRSNDEALFKETLQLIENRIKLTQSWKQEILSQKVDSSQAKFQGNLVRATNLESLKSNWSQIITNELFQFTYAQTKNSLPNTYSNNFITSFDDYQSSEIEKLKELDIIDLNNVLINSFVGKLNDKTEYMPPIKFSHKDFKMAKELIGIGAVFNKKKYGEIYFQSFIPEGACFNHPDLKIGMILEGYSEKDTPGKFHSVKGLSLKEVTQLQYELSHDINVHIRDPKTNFRSIISLTKRKIDLSKIIVKSEILSDKNKKIAYIKIPDFYLDHKRPNGPSASKHIKQALLEINQQGIEHLIIDIRNNGGGYLKEVADTLKLFLNKGPLLQVKSYNGHVNILHDLDSVTYNKNIYVLINANTSSGAEIFAATLQDYQRAIIIGNEKTFGHGYVQHLVPLNLRLPSPFNREKMGNLRLTIQEMFRINGNSLNKNGITPDLPFVTIHQNSHEGTSISPQPYKVWNNSTQLDKMKHILKSMKKPRTSITQSNYKTDFKNYTEYKQYNENLQSTIEKSRDFPKHELDFYLNLIYQSMN